MVLVVAFILNLPAVSSFAPIQWFEYKVLDFRYRLRYELNGPPKQSDSIVIIGVDDYTTQVDDLSPELLEEVPLFNELSQPWPWPREVFASTLSKLLEADARLVIFDFVFASERPGDASFVEVIEANFDKVVLASHFIVKDTAQGRIVREEMPEPFMPIDPKFDNLAKGFASVRLDGDAAVRRMYHATNLIYENRPEMKSDEFTPNTFSLSAVAYRKLKGASAPLPSSDFDNLINYQATRDWFPYVSLKDVFIPDQWNGSRLKGGDFFKDKVVLIGPISEMRFKDNKLTPMGMMPGVEVHAHTLLTLLELGPILDAKNWQVFTLSLCLGYIVIGLALTRWPMVLKITLAGTLLLVAFVFTQALFQSANLLLPMGPPLLSLSFVGVFFFSMDFTLERYQRFRVYRMLDRFVSPDVAKLLVDDRGGFEQLRRGDTRSVAIMFSDVRNFTAHSEKTVPAQVVAQLNEYFENQVESILNTKGTLIAYSGDGIMAAWGDTKSFGAEQDSRNAVSCALRMIEGIGLLNQEWARRGGRAEFEIGIGINFGEATVGSIGHSKRMEFSCLGDTTNIASRLEGVTKVFHQAIIVSQYVYEQTYRNFSYRFVENVILKGKTEPLSLYTPLGRITEPLGIAYQTYANAIECFERRAFKDAMELFIQAQAEFAADDFLCAYYITRCESLMGVVLPEEWCSAIVLNDK